METLLSPEDLLLAVKKIEAEMGREYVVDKGPRTIDIDILIYGDTKVSTSNLTIPHADVFNRDFVTLPMLDIMPTFRADTEAPGYILSNPVPVIPTARGVLRLDGAPVIMGILNMTPDSFTPYGRTTDVQ